MRKLKIGGATVNQTPFDWSNNTANILGAIEEARKLNVKILCLPELCVTGYGCEDLFLSEWLAARAWKELAIIKNSCTDITVTVGLPVRIDNTTYNGACVIRNQKILGITFKQNLANDGVHYEPRWFKAWSPNMVSEIIRDGEKIAVGDLTYAVDGIQFGFEICEDAWQRTDRPGVRLAERRVDLILNPSASHFAMGKSQQREQQVVADGSRMFRCAYVFSNLLGNEAGRMIYDGDIIIAQHGNILAINKRLSFRRFQVMATEVNFDDPAKSVTLTSTDNKNRNEELTQAIALGLYDYLRKSKARGFVISLSGGADSASCAVFVAEMVRRAVNELEWKVFNITLALPSTISDLKSAVSELLSCAYQGTQNSSSETLQAAELLAKSLGAQFHHWKIDDEVASYTAKIENAIERKLTWQTDDVTLQNIQARTRSPIIWMLANVKRAVLITTSNRSEGDVGYATMDGDTSGSFAPIAGLSKTFVLQWLKWAEKELGHSGLRYVNSLQPTAELRPLSNHQTDEDDLMPYTVLVEIERHAIQHRKPPREVFEAMSGGLDSTILKNYIKKFYRLWSANQWKRERLAPSFHLDDLNIDPRTWCRFPILSSGFAEELSELDSL